MHQSEAELVQRAKRKDQAAIEEIYNQNQTSVFTYVYYRVGDQKYAEDLTSDVFVRMLTNLHRYKHGDKPLIAWLYSIARNLVADHFRAKMTKSLTDFEESLTDGEKTNPDNILENNMTQECLQRAMIYLTDEQRQVVILKFIEGRDNAEIAAILGKNERAIRSMQHRALAALSRSIEKERCNEE